jgi:hypothetical protein
MDKWTAKDIVQRHQFLSCYEIIFWIMSLGPNTKALSHWVKFSKVKRLVDYPLDSPDHPQNVWTVAVSEEWVVLHSLMDPTYHMHEIGRVYSAELAQAQPILSFLNLPPSL